MGPAELLQNIEIKSHSNHALDIYISLSAITRTCLQIKCQFYSDFEHVLQ